MIARRLHEDVGFRVLGAGYFPDHLTFREFRTLPLCEFTEFFTQMVCLACEMGMLELGTIALDGTKIRASASASHHKTMISTPACKKRLRMS
jgi:transposase